LREESGHCLHRLEQRWVGGFIERYERKREKREISRADGNLPSGDL
jgi:hypothetical protein